jgi:hypothetical protein
MLPCFAIVGVQVDGPSGSLDRLDVGILDESAITASDGVLPDLVVGFAQGAISLNPLADFGLNLFGQFQQEQPPSCRLVLFVAERFGGEQRTLRFDPRGIIERSDTQIRPAPLPEDVNDPPVEAPPQSPPEPAARVIPERAHLVRQLDPEELRYLFGEVVIEAVLPAPASNVGPVARDELPPGVMVAPVGGPPQERRVGSRGFVGIHR